MKALIWIIILLLVGVGIWWFVREPDVATPGGDVSTGAEVQVEDDIDLSEFQDKG